MSKNKDQIAYHIAGVMMAHFVGSIDSPYEFFPEDYPETKGVADAIDEKYDNVRAATHDTDLHEKILVHLRGMMKTE